MISQKINRIVVLDYDGVLTDDNTTYLQLDPSKYRISKQCYENLLDILVSMHAKVLISSNWRKFNVNDYWMFKGEKFYNPLPNLEEKLKGFIIGKIPNSLRGDKQRQKADMFQLWLHDTGYQGKYVIFDDMEEGYLSYNNMIDKFIQTNYHTGLSKNDVEKAKSILN